jgi:hypothetical protein
MKNADKISQCVDAQAIEKNTENKCADKTQTAFVYGFIGCNRLFNNKKPREKPKTQTVLPGTFLDGFHIVKSPRDNHPCLHVCVFNIYDFFSFFLITYKQ